MVETILLFFVLLIILFGLVYPSTAKALAAFFLCSPLFIELFFWKASAVYFLKKLQKTKDWKWFALSTKLTIKFFTVLEEIDNVLGEAMPIKISTNEVTNYVPIDCREDDVQTVIKMRRVPPLKAAKIKDTMYKVEGTKVIAGNLQTARCRMTLEAITGWDNVLTEDGKSVEFDAGNKELMFSYLPPSLQEELTSVFGGGDYDRDVEQRLLAGEDEEDELADDLAAEDESLAEEGTLQ